MSKLLLPAHYSLWCDPPDEAGDEVLHIVSERRSLKLKGRAFREFVRTVVPLLDGRHTVEEIQAHVGDLFDAEDLAECLALLTDQGVIAETSSIATGPLAGRLAPQLNFFHEVAPGIDFQTRLATATVAVVGLGGAGATVALALGAAGIGTIRCIDPMTVAEADVYLNPALASGAIGRERAEAVAAIVRAAAEQVRVLPDARTLESEDDLRHAVDGADYVVSCLDAGQSNLQFKLNRVCLATGQRWIACALGGAEVTVGPAIHPGRSACYLCYRMRVVACAGNPEAAFAHERLLDRRKRDDSDRRENLVFGAGLAANVIGLEVVKELTGMAEPSLVGRLMTIRLTDLTTERHTVLRKPWCPACFMPAK